MDVFKAAELYQNHSLILNGLWMFYAFMIVGTMAFAIESTTIVQKRSALYALIGVFLIFAAINGGGIVMAEMFRTMIWDEISRTGLNIETDSSMSRSMLPVKLSHTIKRLDVFTPQNSAIIHMFIDLFVVGAIFKLVKCRKEDLGK
ncbi:MAG: hypothetical protein ACI9S8_002403 [Chlamydiales bacterium]|jgi:hypothetical protein